ncbi:MAG: hypothetical protein R3D55_17755 [Chloroflexota bacterium]
MLKWQHGSCYTSGVKPAGIHSRRCDLEQRQQARSHRLCLHLFALNGENGTLQWRAGTTANRTWPGVVVADIDSNNDLGGHRPKRRLPHRVRSQRQPGLVAAETNELRGLSVYDLDAADAFIELVVTSTGDGVA